MRIRFLSDQTYDTGAPGKGPKFPEGFVLDESGVAAALGLKDKPTAEFTSAFLRRWVNRSVAEEVDNGTHVSEPGAAVPLPDGRSIPVQQPLGTAKHGEPTKGLDDGKQVVKTDYEALTRVDLDALAKKRKIDVSDAKTKGDVIAALQLAEELGVDD